MSAFTELPLGIRTTKKPDITLGHEMSHDDQAEQELRLSEALKLLKESAVESLPTELREMATGIFTFRSTLNSETDRGAALMAASFLEGTLKDLLARRLVDDKKILKGAFEHRGVAGSFTALIDLSYLVGILSKVAYRDLHLIRLIRNDFGHVAGPISFASHAIKQRCMALSFAASVSDASGRVRFNRAVMSILGSLMVVAFEMVRLTAKPDPKIPGKEAEAATMVAIKRLIGIDALGQD